MRTFVLIPGAGGVAWYWHRVVPLLMAAGHEAIPVDLPGDDEHAGLPEYEDIVAGAIAGRRGVTLVAQSLGGFTAPLVATRTPVSAIVLVNAMVPVPGETPGAWWGNTRAAEARTQAAVAGRYSAEFDQLTYFLHDVPADVIATGEGHQRAESDAVFGSVCTFEAWPDVPVKVVIGAQDRFFPAAFQRRVALDRLGVVADELPGGHLIALSRPEALAAYLLAA